MFIEVRNVKQIIKLNCAFVSVYHRGFCFVPYTQQKNDHIFISKLVLVRFLTKNSKHKFSNLLSVNLHVWQRLTTEWIYFSSCLI